MCGRYTLITDIVDILSHFGIEIYEDRGLNPQFNVAPSRTMPIITADKQLSFLNWGIDYKSNFVINVRSEGRFRRAKSWQRCLVPADGYFEWRKEKGIKQPYYFKDLSKPWFMFAGLYQVGATTGFTILTMEANEQVIPYHHRMPIMLSSSNDFDSWLNNNEIPTIMPKLNIYAVNRAVSNARNNTPLCIEPVKQRQMRLSLR